MDISHVLIEKGKPCAICQEIAERWKTFSKCPICGYVPEETEPTTAEVVNLADWKAEHGK